MASDQQCTTDGRTVFSNSIHWEALQGGAAPQPRTEMDYATLSADVLARLEALDDVIFAAIEGDPDALDLAAATWQCTLGEVGPEMLEESRQQYLRFAKSVWEATREHSDEPPPNPFAAIEIIGLLAQVDR
jgi:hypothetical protein